MFLSLSFFAFAQPNPVAYLLTDGKGKEVAFAELVKAATKADVVLFGELHDDAIAHWLQLELTRALHKQLGRDLVIGMEMLERQMAPSLADYLLGNIDYKAWSSRVKLWPNFATDYLPIVDYARRHQLQVVATNVERKYASMVFQAGPQILDSQPDSIKAQLAPLPYPVPTEPRSYQEILEMAMQHGGTGEGPGAGNRGKANEAPEIPEAAFNFLAAQAIKDATMAWFILENMPKAKKGTFLHLNGSFHNKYGEGIGWYLQHYLAQSSAKRAKLTVLTISTARQAELTRPEAEHLGTADYLILVPETMTRTH